MLFFENKRKRERNFAVGPLERFGRLHISPWPAFREGAAFASRNPAALVPGGEGEVGEELEDIDGYPKVVLDGVGGDWTELAAVAVGAAAGVDGGGGAPVRDGG